MLSNKGLATRLFSVGLASCAFALTAACCPVKAARDDAKADWGRAPAEMTFSTIVPGVVLDPARNVVYIMRPRGGIESVDVDSGKVRWTSAHADQPLFVADDILLARVASNAPGLVIASLDPDSGDPVANVEAQILPLPSGVVASIDNTLARTFKLNVTQSGDEIILAWEFVLRDVSGIAPADRRGILQQEAGAFRYLKNGFEAASPESISNPREHWPKELQALYDSKRLRRAPWQTAETLAFTQQDYRPDRLLLRRWRQLNGESLEDRTLYEGRALAVLGSCDEQHIVVAVPSGRPAPEPRYELHFYALDTAELVAKLGSLRSAAPFCVLGSRLVTVSLPATRRENGVLVTRPLELLAVDLASMNEVWRRALRDTAFRGIAPPTN